MPASLYEMFNFAPGQFRLISRFPGYSHVTQMAQSTDMFTFVLRRLVNRLSAGARL
jgi:hypothetical protein